MTGRVRPYLRMAAMAGAVLWAMPAQSQEAPCIDAPRDAAGARACFVAFEQACHDTHGMGEMYDLCFLQAHQALDRALEAQVRALQLTLVDRMGGMAEIVDLEGEFLAWQAARIARCRRDAMIQYGMGAGLSRATLACQVEASILRWAELSDATPEAWPGWP